MRPIWESDLVAPADDPEIGFRLRPDLHTWLNLVPLRTNSHGLRYREVDRSKPDGVFRAVVLGSSFTLPSGVRLEDSFHGQLESRFRRLLERPVEFVNFHLRAEADVARPQFRPVAPAGRSVAGATKPRRIVIFPEAGRHEVAVYERDRLPPGFTADGPLLIEEPSSTTLLHRGERLTVDEIGFLHISQAA